MKNHDFVNLRVKRGIALAAMFLGIAAPCDPAGAATANLSPPPLSGRASIPVGWDTGGFDRRFESRSAGGFDRQFIVVLTVATTRTVSIDISTAVGPIGTSTPEEGIYPQTAADDDRAGRYPSS